MENLMNEMSIVQYIPYEDVSKCGYCKKRGFNKYGLWAFQLTVKDYQSLIDRGWRRSGHYCYKPILADSCCQMYTIRCDSRSFRLSKCQKRILKRMNVYLQTGCIGNVKQGFNNIGLGDLPLDQDAVFPPSNTDVTDIVAQNVDFGELKVDNRKKESCHKSKKVRENGKSLNVSVAADVQGTHRPLKAKYLRINRKREKLIAKGLTDEEIARKMVEKKRYPVVKHVEDFIDIPSQDKAAHIIEVRLVRTSPRSPEFNATYEDGYQLYKKYQKSVHNDRDDHLTRRSYENFLVDSPLMEESQYGSFHQQYWLDNKLIAVGVVDILPACISSVYLFYDPDYAFLCLGTYGALRELQLVRSLTKSSPDLAYYYMGFYIRSCVKMRYKGDFKPSFLLCPEAYSWHPIEICLPKIDLHNYSRLNEDPEAEDTDVDGDAINDVFLIYKSKLTLFSTLQSLPASVKQVVTEYCSLVGASCTRRMILQYQ